ncbi:MAG TPA: hypothetical protein PLW93_02870 [Candidatus Absconditabacterales bacterium]|nr:hypothetical protein [Candidatus Absconditabacterales bacterium]
MSSKQQVLIKLLKKLEKYRNLAEGIGVLLQAIPVDDKILDGIVTIIADAVKKTENQTHKQKLQDAISLIQKIRQDEENEKESTNIEALLENL